MNQRKRIVIITEDSIPDRSINGYAVPAQSTFSGLFREVRIFSEKLNVILPTELLIISSKYGLIGKNTTINIYDNKILKIEDISELDKKTSFDKQLSEKVEGAHIILFLLPAPYLKYLMHIGWITGILKNHKIIMVTGRRLRNNLLNNPDIIYLERKGVARIGLRNQELIINIIASYEN